MPEYHRAYKLYYICVEQCTYYINGFTKFYVGSYLCCCCALFLARFITNYWRKYLLFLNFKLLVVETVISGKSI